MKLCLTWLDEQPGPLAVRSFREEKPAPIWQPQQHPDEAALKNAAHKLKGSCLAVGIPLMADLCGKLEDGEGDPAPLFAELERVFAAAEREMSAQLANKAS